MRTYFNELSQQIKQACPTGCEAFAYLRASDLNYCRFNQGKIRQVGEVHSVSLALTLVSDNKHLKHTLSLNGELSEDKPLLVQTMNHLAQQLPMIAPDPYLCLPESPTNSEQFCDSPGLSFDDMIHQVGEQVSELDFVGIVNQPKHYVGFYSTTSQSNWFETQYCSLDWSLYHQGDKAVKCGMAASQFNQDDFKAKLKENSRDLSILTRTPKTLSPGNYRVYLSPSATADLLRVASLSGFSGQSIARRQSMLNKLYAGEECFSDALNIQEDISTGFHAPFQAEGFVKPTRISLVDKGVAQDRLVSPRTAQELGLSQNGAEANEMPASLVLEPLAQRIDDHLSALDTGIYINQVWYVNCSDMNHARLTGMTRFACFWVENGQIQAPINVMRFDDSLYHLLGKNCLGFTKESEWLFDPASYETFPMRVDVKSPGLLVKDMAFTL